MRPPPATAVVLWSLLLNLDLVSAQQPKHNLSEPNAPHHGPGAKRKQPHIIFILIDDQVCRDAVVVAASRGRPSPPQLYKLPRVGNPDPESRTDHILFDFLTNLFSQVALLPLTSRGRLIFIAAGSFLPCCHGFSHV